MDFIIEVSDQSVKDLLSRLAGKAADPTPIMRKISGIMADAVEENFAQEGRPKWPGLAESTKKQRAQKGHWPGQILQVSGQLAASISRRYDSESATVGTNKKYARIHQLGGQAGRGRKVTIPARPYLQLGENDLADQDMG